MMKTSEMKLHKTSVSFGRKEMFYLTMHILVMVIWHWTDGKCKATTLFLTNLEQVPNLLTHCPREKSQISYDVWPGQLK